MREWVAYAMHSHTLAIVSGHMRDEKAIGNGPDNHRSDRPLLPQGDLEISRRPPPNSAPDQVEQLVVAQSAAHLATFKKVGGKVALAAVESEDFLLDTILDDQAVDSDRPLLPDAMCAIGGLILDRRIPPGVEMDHVVGGGQVQSGAARLEADEKQRRVGRLKGRGASLLILGRRAPVKILIADATLVESRAHALQVTDELAEYQCLVMVAYQLVDEVEDGLQFGSGQFGLRVDQTRMAARPPQACDLSQNVKATPAGKAFGWSGQRFQRLAAQRLVKGALLRREIDLQSYLGARRQLAQHCTLGSPQDEGADQR